MSIEALGPIGVALIGRRRQPDVAELSEVELRDLCLRRFEAVERHNRSVGRPYDYSPHSFHKWYDSITRVQRLAIAYDVASHGA